MKTNNRCRKGCSSCLACKSAEPSLHVEWAQINDRQVVVTTADKMWVHELDQNREADPFAEPMEGPGSLETTRQLLEAAWCAAFMAAGNNRPAPRKSLPRYVWDLIGYYHSTSNTPITLTEAAARFRAADRADLEAFARRFARLESGDEAMAVADLEALGYEAKSLVAACPPPPSAVASVNHYRSLARGPEPIEVFGYCYALERSALALTQEDLRAYEELMPPGVSAISCRWHHSGVGGDVAHMKAFLRLCSRLPAEDRARIVRAVYDSVIFISSVPAEEADDAALEKRFSTYRPQPAEMEFGVTEGAVYCSASTAVQFV
jgi:pyrroloquinoline quinone (PQQ) biosynthesis protein C